MSGPTESRGVLSGLIRQPLLHFLLIGAAIGLVHAQLRERNVEEPRTIRITAAEVDRLAVAWQARWNRPPTPEELDGAIRAQVRETVLYREALALGLDEGDPVIRRVLGQKLEVMTRDLVELGLSPTEPEIQAYFAENAERYQAPPVLSFSQVFLDPDRRGDRTLEDAAEILADLRAGSDPRADGEGAGDSLMLESFFAEKTEQRVTSLFGSGFARSLFELPPGAWHGPVLSGYGTHLVYVHERREFPPPALDEIRELVTQDWVQARREEITEQYYDELLSRYEVIVEREPAVPGTAAATTP